MFVLTLLMIVLGCFIDGISILVLMTSVLMPVIRAAKIDPLWFGFLISSLPPDSHPGRCTGF